jgi:alpha-glucosidase (family GH31 glycosyl hydrolase)
VFLNDTLVAPIDDQLHGNQIAGNVTTRSVWLPPGRWHDAWSGQVTTVSGCGTSVNVTQPYERVFQRFL